MASSKNTKTISRQVHTIDASGETPGRLATKIACLLQGKHKAEYEYQWDGGDAVVVKNASKMVFTGKKLFQKEYCSYTGYPGGLRRKLLKDVFEKDPDEVIRHAVLRMLPNNRLRKERIKRLKVLR